MDQIFQYLEAATYVITILGLPAAIIFYLKEQKQQRLEREYGTFDALDNKYIEIQQLCIEHPELDVFDTPYETPSILSEGQKKQEEAILLIRISIFERAYLMYSGSATKVKKDQWAGWEDEIKDWLERPNFLKVWQEHSPYFDLDFAAHFNQFIRK